MKVYSCAIRTRAYAGIKMRLEISSFKGISNSITTVSKDTLILIME